jgi:hypothetical protein
VINVHIPRTTLLELDHRSGWVEGYGPVSAEHTRLLVPTAGLRQVFVAQDSGLPLGLGSATQPSLTDAPPTPPKPARSSPSRSAPGYSRCSAPGPSPTTPNPGTTPAAT